jgi:predicted CoA-binding protein
VDTTPSRDWLDNFSAGLAVVMDRCPMVEHKHLDI